MRRSALIVLVLLFVAMVSPAFAEGNPSDVAADFNNDGFADLAVGVPGENNSAGAVNVLYGTAGGLSGTGGQLFFQVGGAVEDADNFGSALAAGDFNHDGFAELAAAAPSEGVGSAGGAGAVSVLPGSAGGRLFTQDSPGVTDVAESGDSFGGTSFVAG